VGIVILAILLFVVLALAGSSFIASLGEPTGTPTLNSTEANQTVEARLTQAASLTPVVVPSLIPTDSGVPTPTRTPTVSPTITQPAVTSSPTPPCDKAAAGNPIDITIPDDTVMEAGQTFTKKWGLVNTGTCDWTPKYAAAWFSGEMLGAPSTVPIGVLVQPGSSAEISVDMVAPLEPGTYRSNWKLQNETGVLFGIGPNGDSAFWVQIVVESVSTNTPAPSPLPSSTVLPTSTPQVLVSGPAELAPGDSLDADSLQVNPASGADLLYQADENGAHWLAPQPGALVGVYGNSQPGQADCQAASLNTSPLPVESLPSGSYLCYQTDLGHYGWAQLLGQDPNSAALSLQILTWSQL
jgi:hypothetical protein